jgi:nitroimidazol reductase NimA-like FMN-containing flavoprotein (pyridoxamine 5'-phosphate oxidase superfamily)
MTPKTDVAALQRESFARCSPATGEAFPEVRRMDGEALERFLARKQYLVLSTTRPDGRPHAAMSAFLLDGDRFWCPTMAGTVRTRNLAAQPRVSIVVTEGEGDEHAVVLCEGEARTPARGEEPEGLEDRWLDKFGWGPDWAESWIAITPTRILTFAAPGWRA